MFLGSWKTDHIFPHESNSEYTHGIYMLIRWNEGINASQVCRGKMSIPGVGMQAPLGIPSQSYTCLSWKESHHHAIP